MDHVVNWTFESVWNINGNFYAMLQKINQEQRSKAVLGRSFECMTTVTIQWFMKGQRIDQNTRNSLSGSVVFETDLIRTAHIDQLIDYGMNSGIVHTDFFTIDEYYLDPQPQTLEMKLNLYAPFSPNQLYRIANKLVPEQIPSVPSTHKTSFIAVYTCLEYVLPAIQEYGVHARKEYEYRLVGYLDPVRLETISIS